MLVAMFAGRRVLAGGVLVGSLAFGCAHAAPYAWVYDLSDEVLTGRVAAVEPQDRLFVFVRDQPTMSVEVVVADDRTIALPIVGVVSVANCTLDQVQQRVTQGLQGILQKPEVGVSLVARRPAEVSVIGEVRSPGAFELAEGTQVIDVLARAGGLTEFAHPNRVYVVRRGPPAMRVRFRYRELASGEVASSRFVLLDGDVVVVE